MQDAIPDILHPTRGDALSELERELWRIRMATLEVQVLLRGYFSAGDVVDVIPEGLQFSLTNHGLILVSKFLEVWDDFGGLAKREPRVIDARSAVSPLVKRIEAWKGIRAFRNTALAHSYTTSDGRLVGPWYLLHSHQAPTYHAEVIVLLQCVMYAAAGVLATFLEEYKALGPSFRSPYPVPSPGPGIQYGTDITSVVNPLLASVNKNLERLGVPLSNSVFAEFKSEVQPEPPSASEASA